MVQNIHGFEIQLYTLTLHAECDQNWSSGHIRE